MKKLVFLTLLLWSIKIFAQVGIDNPTPNPYSIVDMKATDKGMLIPRMTTAERFAIKTDCAPTCPEGLLVFDTDKSAFFYVANNQWYALNPFTTPDAMIAAAEDIQTSTVVSNVGIGTAPAPGYKLDVNGKVNISDGVDVTNGVNVATGSVVVSNSSGTVSTTDGNIHSTNGDIKTTNGKLEAKGFSTDPTATNVSGPVPQGGIIMWAGLASNVPSGWALCDGTQGTPDLKGRFIVGAAAGASDVNAQGGQNSVTLTEAQMPMHNHGGGTDNGGQHNHGIPIDWTDNGHANPNGNGTNQLDMTGGDNINNFSNAVDGEAYTSPGGAHSHTISPSGGDQPFDNRPAFYVLAFIMKK